MKVDRLGDFVLALSAIRQAVAHFGEEDCVLVISPQAELLAAREFPHTARLVLPAAVGHKRLLWESWKARRLLRNISCETVICLRYQRSDWDELMLLWLRGQRCYVLDDAQGESFFAPRNTYSFPARERIRIDSKMVLSEAGENRGCRELELHRQLLAAATGRPVSLEDILPRFNHIDGASKGPIVLVSPLGSHAIRDFPEALLGTTLEALRRNSKAPVRLFGDATQLPRLEALAEKLRSAGLGDVACSPAMSVVAFAEAIGKAALVLTVETSTAHIAAALDKPTIVLIGGGHFGQFGPWRSSERQIWITNPMDCFGCNWRCIYPEPYCITRVTPDAINVALAQVLEKARIQ